MQDLLRRLRAALSPQSALLLVLALLLLFGGMDWRQTEHLNRQTALEARISKALSSMDGAGHVSVVIRTREKNESEGWKTVNTQEDSILGAVAIAQGAGDPVVRLELQQALCALLGLPAASVSVVTGGG